MDHDLLAEPLLTWRAPDGEKSHTTLPGLLSLIASGQVGDFPRVRAHQFRPWLMFLTQLAGIAVHRAGGGDPTLGEVDWQRLLLRLTGGDRAPWCLVEEDLRRPAFFQPPVPEGSIECWKTTCHPDDLDILVTAKGHDVKASLIPHSDIEAWVYALVTLQTMEGFLGQGNYGIARMNSGFGNRPYISLAPDLRIGSGFRRDVEILLSTWPVLVREHGFADEGASLLWLYEWDGKTALARGALSPHFIEVCRRLRLEKTPGGLRCRRSSSSVKRTLPESKGGDVGDPWIPMKRGGEGPREATAQPTALTVSKWGFDYRLLSELLLVGEDYEPSVASIPRKSDGQELALSAWALARGQGTTEGLHERAVLVTGPTRWRLEGAETRSEIGRRAKLWIGIAERMRANVLYPALKRLTVGSTVPDDCFSARLDDIFFQELFGNVELPEDDARLGFERRLRDIAWSELQRVIDSCAVPETHRLRAVSEAEGLFYGCLRRNFPDIVRAAAGREGVIP